MNGGQIAVSHFGLKTVRALAKKGVTFLGTCVIPDMASSMPYANGSTGYQMSDNGTGKVWSYSEVVAAAK